MHIKRAKVDHHGPLRDIDLDLEPGFHLCHGKNESGKTLLVESIIKMLLEDNAGHYQGLNRVDHPPAGHLLIDNSGNEILLPDQGFDAVFPDLTPEDIRNALIIRDFDLRLPERQDDFGSSSYLREVTDRITGAQTQRIESIRGELKEIGYLTNSSSDARLVNRQDGNPPKLGDKRDDAKDLAKEIREYLEKCQDIGTLHKFRLKRDLTDEKAENQSELELLRKAQKAKKLEDGRDLLKTLRKTQKQLDEHEKRQQNEIKSYDEIKDRITAYREQRKDLRVDPDLYQKGLYGTTGLFILTIIAAILSPVSGLGIIAGILFLVTAGLAYKYWEVKQLEKKATDIVDDAQHLGISGVSLPEVAQSVNGEIESFRATGEDLRGTESNTVGQLQQLFDGQGETIGYWEGEIEKFAEEVEDVDKEFDEERLETLEQRQKEIEEELEELEQDLREHTKRISDFDKAVAGLPLEQFLEVEDVRVQSVTDLEPTADLLEEFVSEIKDRVQTATTAIEIFEEIEEEEEREINHLFADESYAVQFFRDATDGNYVDIRYDESDNAVRVTRADGTELTADKLSQGTYDLLYMAIRFTLARDLLDDEPGFLILDDAFLHSDPDRVTREIEILNDLSTDGWQILYFSIRDAVRDAVEGTSGASIEELPELEFRG